MDLEYNRFIKEYNELWLLKDITVKEKVINKKILKVFNTYKEVPIHKEFNDNFVYFMSRTFTHKELSFNILWEFCQFIRYVDKIVFYKNTLNNVLYVDSDLYATGKREFGLKKDNLFNMRFTLEKLNGVNVIKLQIDRLYGKQMKTTFNIVDGNVKYNDVSDSMLMDKVNDILYEEVYKTTYEILSQIAFPDRIFYHDSEINKRILNAIQSIKDEENGKYFEKSIY